jgi:hypothetical protein
MKTQKMPSGSDRTQRLESVERTQRMDAAPAEQTQRLATASPERTQRIDTPAADTQRLGPTPQPAKADPDGDKTMKIPKLDPGYRPEATQQLGASGPEDTQQLDFTATQKVEPAAGDSEAERTQRMDDSIWRLQEAKRILQGVREKS